MQTCDREVTFADAELLHAAAAATRICHLTGVHASLKHAGAQHPIGDLVAHQTLAYRAVDNPHLCLLQDGGALTWRTQRLVTTSCFL